VCYETQHMGTERALRRRVVAKLLALWREDPEGFEAVMAVIAALGRKREK